MLVCVDSLPVVNTSEAVNSSTTAAETVDVGHKMAISEGRLSSGKLLSRSTTEFELQCESDVDDERAAKRLRPDENVTTVISSTGADSMSGGVLVSLSSLNSVDDEADYADSSTALDSSTAAGMRVSTENVLPHLKHKRNYNTKASHVICM